MIFTQLYYAHCQVMLLLMQLIEKSARSSTFTLSDDMAAITYPYSCKPCITITAMKKNPLTYFPQKNTVFLRSIIYIPS